MNFNDITNRVKSLFSVSRSKGESATLMDSGGFFGTPQSDWLSLYSENPRLAVVHKIAEDNGATEYEMLATNRRTKFVVTNHPFASELNKHSIPPFFSLWSAYRLMTGVVYIAFDLDAGKPTDFKLFTTTQVMRKADAKDNTYTFKYGSGTLTYPSTQVIIDTDLDLKNPYFSGKGKAEAVKDEIETDEFVQKYIKYFYINSARPDVFITAEKGEEMSEADVKRLENEWLGKFQGVHNSHKPVFLNWAASVTSVPTSHKDMELLDTRKFYRDTTIQHFGVPPEIMGIIENSNRATVIAAEHIYAKQVRMPILSHIEKIINTKILPLYNDPYLVEFKFENIIPDDIELTQKIVDAGIKNRTLIVNEWRVAMGYPKIVGDYGNSIIGDKSVAGLDTALVVQVEDTTLDTREYKDYSEMLAEDFRSRAEEKLGKPLDGELVIVRDEKGGKG